MLPAGWGWTSLVCTLGEALQYHPKGDDGIAKKIIYGMQLYGNECEKSNQ